MSAKTNYTVIPYETIQKAVNGDKDALKSVLIHYTNYIKKLSQRPFTDTYGNVTFLIDEQLKQQIESRLIIAIQKFRL